MSLGKRKADVSEDGRPSKKSARHAPPQVKIVYREGPEAAKPVVATAPGLSLPSNLKFQSFTRTNTNGTSDLLLHSTTHPTLDFTAAENDAPSEKYLKHYIAVFDPDTGDLQVTEARRVTARGSLRQRASEDDGQSDEDEPETNYSSRAILTNTFGTKKSKKAVQSMADNRLLSRSADAADDPIARALLSSMPEPDALDDIDVQQLAQSNKPLPIPDLSTEDISQVYALNALVFPNPAQSTLTQLPTATWIDAVQKDRPILTRSRFVSNRVAYLSRACAQPPATDDRIKLTLQLLRYTLLLIEIESHLRSLKTHSRIPDPSNWPPKTISGGIPHDLTNGLLTHFFGPNRFLQKTALTLLHTTILALTLHIPPPSLNPGPNILIADLTDIQLDLALEPKTVAKYYRELGCRMLAASDADLAVWGLEKIVRQQQKKKKKEKKNTGRTLEGTDGYRAEEEGEGEGEGMGKPKIPPRPKFARLAFPLSFPSVSKGRPSQRR